MSEFQRKHYEAIAEVLKQCRRDCRPLEIPHFYGECADAADTLDQITARLCWLFQGDDPTFKPELFRKATEDN